MKRLASVALPLVALLAPTLGATHPAANYPAVNGFVPLPYPELPPTAFIDVPFNNTNLYPDGGWTLYPGEPGSFVPSMSVYSHINGRVPPEVSARSVLARLAQLGIPIVPPEPQFLGKNPCVADNVALPVPKGWRKPKEAPKEAPKKIEKGDDKDDKAKSKDDKKGDDKNSKNDDVKNDKAKSKNDKSEKNDKAKSKNDKKVEDDNDD
jgi:hypothetical protein